ncbi:MAG TPA: preprotein translocase subunit SecG [Candidatus Merdicola faecigallinarum]|uniref:Protein-export membrane protein SecG n=1 Tax=Candidatus Merdicola faecigallinarum TaxID=2840862 RepID=A0A9D1M0L2_9FIRM|nr:preprotein translocase subunit SecG [Candidatus Merdicola faecigallinarum]
MEIVKYVLMGIYIINCLALIIIAMLQSKEDTGASGAITGSSTNNFYEKNKGRTKEGKLKKWTIRLGILFGILTIALGIIYVF